MKRAMLMMVLTIAGVVLALALGGCVTMNGPTPFESSGVIAPTPAGCTADVDC